MKTKQEILDAAEERSMNWTWDAKVPVLIAALAAIPNLPREMQEQEKILSAIHLKADIYTRYRDALNGLTSNEIRVRIDPQGPNTTVTVPGRESGAKGDSAAVVRLIDEMNRIEKEIAGTKLDIGAILRFLRTA